MKTHYHICASGHKWKCSNVACNLSKHASCGFTLANDLAVCLKTAKIQKPEKRFTYSADENGFRVLYRGEPILKAGLTAIERKVKRPYPTRKKAARLYTEEAVKITAMLDNGEGDAKLWRKIRRFDKLAKVG